MKKILVVMGAISLVLGGYATVFSAHKEGIIIRTDKTYYKGTGEFGNMTIKITNNLNEPVYFSDYSFENVQMRSGLHWDLLESPLRDIRPNIKINLAEHHTSQEKIQPSFMYVKEYCKRTGKYRIAAIAYLGCSGTGKTYHPDSCSSSRVIYSNTFVVKWDKEN